MIHLLYNESFINLKKKKRVVKVSPSFGAMFHIFLPKSQIPQRRMLTPGINAVLNRTEIKPSEYKCIPL